MVKAFTERGDSVFGIDVVEAPDDERSQVRDALDFFRSPWSGPRFDLAIHCAAVIGGRAGIDGSPLAVATNLALDAWFFRWLERAQVSRAVYFSSSAAYPVDLQDDFATARPLREDDIPQSPLNNIGRPDATYGWAKLTGEQLAATARAGGQQVLIVRPFSGYGADQPVDYPFPALMQRVMESHAGDPIEVWGDPRAVRDWIHIDDIVAAVMRLLETGEDGPVNLGTGIATPFRSLVEQMLLAAHGLNHQRVVQPVAGRPEGVVFRVANPERLYRTFVPQITLAEGIARAVYATKAGAHV
jgi:nucleoside-diphosphate-sugar epimerase